MSLNLLGATRIGADAPSLDAVRAGNGTIRKGMRGPAVEYVQKHAGLTGSDADGIFGDKTDAAVRKFQSGMELEPDGVVGKDTLEALDGAYIIEEKAPPLSTSTAPSTATKVAAGAAVAGGTLLIVTGIGIGAIALVAGIIGMTHEG